MQSTPQQPDAGRQAERTALSWRRTSLGLIAVGALAIRWSVAEDFPPYPGVLLCAFGGVAGLFIVRARYQRVLHTVGTGQTPLSRYLIPVTTLVIVAVVVAFGIGIAAEFARD
ncbi:MAG: DUF202 domain-containing protein [Mycobacterium sp.]|nr:DUF202 domain-containing protein [Mycobacterium sp.]